MPSEPIPTVLPPCHACGAAAAERYKFCPQCGAPGSQFCARCNTPNSHDAKFCKECGVQLSSPPIVEIKTVSGTQPVDSVSDEVTKLVAPEGERRHVTVMLADISGYTAMNEKCDPEIVNDLLDRIKSLSADVVKRHGGIVNQFIGDEIVALFGLGKTENSAQAAVQAACDIRDSVKSMDSKLPGLMAGNVSMHFGICSGLLVIRPSSNRDGLFSLTGDTINTASRLLHAAGREEIVIGPENQRAVQSFFMLEPIDPMTLKGKERPINPFKVLGVQPIQSSFQARAALGFGHFTGREVELAQLRQLIERARDGEGQVVSISGEPGVGKSRLIHEFLEDQKVVNADVCLGRCSPSMVDTPYHPWIELGRSMLGLDVADDAAKVVATLQGHDVPLRHVPAFLSLLALTSAEYPMPAGVVRSERPRMIRDAIMAVIQAISASRLKVLWLEDWHWADVASDECLRELFRVMARFRILVIVTIRPRTGVAWPIKDNMTAVTLRPLDRKGTGAMVSALLSNAIVPEPLVNLLYERTEGNALFIEEVISLLRHDHLVVVKDGVLSLTRPLASMIIPDTVQSAVLRRLDSLDPAWREVLRRASVLGREFTLSLLQLITPPGADLEGAMATLLGLDFVVTLQTEAEVRYAFKHVITQEVAYETLLHKQRRELHAAVGTAIEEVYAAKLDEYYDQLAFHYARSENYEKALEFLEKAGDRASAAFALDAARSQYMAALNILDQSKNDSAIRRRIEISIKSASASQFAAAERHIEIMNRASADALRIGDADLAANCRYWLGRMYYALGRPSMAIEHFEASLELASKLNDPEIIARCKCVLGRASLFTADVTRGLEYLAQGIESMRELGNESELAYSLSSLGCILALTGQFAAAEQTFINALSITRQKNNLANEALVTQQLSYARCLRGDWDGAIEAGERCIDLSIKCGLPQLLEFGRIFRAYAYAMGYDLSEGHRQMTEAIAAYESSEAQLAASICHGWFAEVCSLRGDLVSARRHADISLARESVGDRFGHLPALRALAQLAANEGLPAAARELLDRAESVADAWGARPDRGITFMRAAEIDRRSADADEMKARAMQLFKDCEMDWWRARAMADP